MWDWTNLSRTVGAAINRYRRAASCNRSYARHRERTRTRTNVGRSVSNDREPRSIAFAPRILRDSRRIAAREEAPKVRGVARKRGFFRGSSRREKGSVLLSSRLKLQCSRKQRSLSILPGRVLHHGAAHMYVVVIALLKRARRFIWMKWRTIKKEWI